MSVRLQRRHVQMVWDAVQVVSKTTIYSLYLTTVDKPMRITLIHLAGYPCSYSGTRPVCDKPCNVLGVRCSQGGCCDAGSSCQNDATGLCTATFGPGTIASPTIPALTIPSITVTKPISSAIATCHSAFNSPLDTTTAASTPRLTIPTASAPVQSFTAVGAAGFNQPWRVGVFEGAIIGLMGFLGL